uniref:Claudin n=1 Tax=Arion vulgaris TaxID=1028688 RepID=A0A0B7B6D6_9EUPU
MAYGTARRWGFAGVVIGFVMCLTGLIAPFWLHTQSYYLVPITKTDIGLWWYCVDTYGTDCHFFRFSDVDGAKVWTFRVGSIIVFILSLSSASVGQKRLRTNEVGKTSGHGATTFLAGAAGIVTITVFDAFVKELNVLSFPNVHYGWAFYVYIVGTSFLVVSSLIFCFAPPDSMASQASTGVQIGTVMIISVPEPEPAQQLQNDAPPPYPNQAYNWQEEPQNINYPNYGQQYEERKQAY